MNSYYGLSLLLGIVHKVYDDIYDNNLYDRIGVPLERIPYVNEFLKCVFGLGYAVISLQYMLFYLFFTVVNVLLYFLKKSEYGAYESMGLLSSLILIPFLCWRREDSIKDIGFLGVLFAGCVALEKMCNYHLNSEYSSRKLWSRSIALVVLVVLLFINIHFHFLSESINIILLFNMGYLLTSCIFQYYLLQPNLKGGEKSGL